MLFILPKMMNLFQHITFLFLSFSGILGKTEKSHLVSFYIYTEKLVSDECHLFQFRDKEENIINYCSIEQLWMCFCLGWSHSLNLCATMKYSEGYIIDNSHDIAEHRFSTANKFLFMHHCSTNEFPIVTESSTKNFLCKFKALQIILF